VTATILELERIVVKTTNIYARSREIPGRLRQQRLLFKTSSFRFRIEMSPELERDRVL